MANETYVTVIGRLTKDPEYRVTPSGAAVAKLSIAVSARKFDKNTNEWKDEATKFWDAEAWNQGKMLFADHLTESLKKGDNVIGHGELRTREFEQDGQKRRADTLNLIALGKDLRWHTGASDVQQSQAANTYSPGGFGGGATAPQSNAGPYQGKGGGGWNAPSNDPWSTTKADDDEPPF